MKVAVAVAVETVIVIAVMKIGAKSQTWRRKLA
jgi:hypothetical protein